MGMDGQAANGGICMTFYDWYSHLLPALPMTWGEQADVSDSAGRYNAGFVMLWGPNIPQTWTLGEPYHKSTKSIVVSPDYSEAARLADMWLRPKQGTDAALAMAIGHVILREFYLNEQVEYFEDCCRDCTDMPMLVRLTGKDGYYVPHRFVRASDFKDRLGEENNPEWKAVAVDYKTKEFVASLGLVGFRGGETKDCKGRDVDLVMTFILDDDHDSVVDVGFPYPCNRETDFFEGPDHPSVLIRKVPVRKVKLADGEATVATVFDLFVADYGLDRGLGGLNSAKSYDQILPYTPAWAEQATGVPRDQIIAVAREFACNAEKTRGRSRVILGAGLNHCHHMNYRSIINLLVMCGCAGQSG